MALKLPRKEKDSILTHEDWNRLLDAVERADSVQFDASSGLQSSTSNVGRTVSFVGFDSVAAIKLTTALPAGDGVSKLGHGQGQIMNLAPGTNGGSDNGTLSVDSNAPSVDVYSLVNGAIKSGSTILTGLVSGQWLYLFTICSNAA